MSDFGWRFDRHYELYKERMKTVSRLSMLAVAFAVIIFVKVVDPHGVLTAEIAAKQELLAQLEEQQNEIQSEERQAEALASTADQARMAVENAAWEEPKEEFKADLRVLQASYDRLVQARPAEFREAADTRVQLRRDTEAMDRVRQAEPGPLDARQLRGDEDRAASRPLRPAERLFTVRDDLAPREEMLRLQPDDLSIDEASEVYRVDPRDLADASADERERILLARRSELTRQRADEAVDEITGRIEESVLEPIRRLTEQAESATFESVRDQVQALDRSVSQWRESHLGNPSWYETIERKDQELNELTETIETWRRQAETAIDEAEERVNAILSDLQGRIEGLRQDIASSEEARASLQDRLDQFLPDWLQRLVSPEEMTQIFPLVLILLVLVIGWNVRSARRHDEAIHAILGERSEYDPLSEWSVWSLRRRRGALDVASTVALYLGGLALIWIIFELSADRLVAWLKTDPEIGVWSFTNPAVPYIRWIGRAVFVMALIGLGVALLFAGSRGGGASCAVERDPESKEGRLPHEA